MVKLYDGGAWLVHGRDIVEDGPDAAAKLAALGVKDAEKRSAAQGTIAAGILASHNESNEEGKLKLRFDAMTSHDITFVGVVQTAKASGLKEFPIPYVLTNCHNSLCAVGGTINEDDHLFGLSAAKKYGGIYVPPHLAVMHMYMREMMAGCGKMILGSDSHTRYGALGTMAIGEGGGELVKQLLRQTYDVNYPRVAAVYLTGTPAPGVGPQDVALAIIGATFKNGFVKNSVMEFVGDGIASLSADYRCGVDVMTTETACLSSIWETDEETEKFFASHGRPQDYKRLAPADVAYYDRLVYVDLSKIRPMIAMPFHPSNAYTIDEFLENAADILRIAEKDAERIGGKRAPFKLTDKFIDGKLHVDQGVIAGCAGGTYTNIMAAASVLSGRSTGCGEFSLSVYPSSQPVMLELTRNGALAELMSAGAVIKSAFCGPCFGAGDVPANGSLSVRHTTRNFENREGSKPANGQMAAVALMDARSIAATAANGGVLTPATDLDVDWSCPSYTFDRAPYDKRVYNGWGKPQSDAPLRYGPNIVDWPEIRPLTEDIFLRVASFIDDPVTTTDELIPSGETSSYRSNPLGLAEFTLSRKDPGYVVRAKATRAVDDDRASGGIVSDAELLNAYEAARTVHGFENADFTKASFGSVVCAVKPGDGSAREQAASCQRVLGGAANIAREYATKRYRSNLINWGMLPFTADDTSDFTLGTFIFIPGIKSVIENGGSEVTAYVLKNGNAKPVKLSLGELTVTERAIISAGCLINFNRI